MHTPKIHDATYGKHPDNRLLFLHLNVEEKKDYLSSHPIDCISAMRSQEKWVRSREVYASSGNFSTAAIVILLEHFYAKQHHHCGVGTHP